MTELVAGGLGPRDCRLLEAAAELRLVTGGQLQRLVFAGPEASTTNARIARRCLERLTAQHLMQRLQRRVGGLRAGSSSFVYALTPSGASAIGRHATRGRVREPSLAFLAHQLAVAETFVQLHEAQYRGELLDLKVQTEPTCWRSIDDGSGSVLKPDLFVVAGLEEHELLAFIEVDNGTEHVGALRRKAGLYRAHYLSGAEQAAEGVFPEVLWQAPDGRRAQQIGVALTGDGSQLHRILTSPELIGYVARGERQEQRNRPDAYPQ